MTQKKILVADDEKDIVELVAYNLEREGFSVFRASDGRRALESIRHDKPDLVILDLMMPEVSGMEVCRMIRSVPKTAGLPIIMLTAKSDPIDKILGLEIGADDYITKPFHVRELIARVRAVLRRSEQRPDGDLPESFDFQGLHIDFKSYRVTLEGRRSSSVPASSSCSSFSPATPGASTAGISSWTASGGRGLRGAPDRGCPYQPPPGRDRTGQRKSAVHLNRAGYRLQIYG